MSADSEPSHRDQGFDDQPTRALLLAQALESCIQAERAIPGSADRLIAHQPAWERGELRRLVLLASSLDAAATNAVMSDDFRVAARGRLMRHIALESAERAPSGNGHIVSGNGFGDVVTMPFSSAEYVVRSRRSKLLWRGTAGGLLSAVLVLAATLTASANALPGEPLYTVKQAQEELGIRLASDDQSRSLALLGQADARLSETARLLQQGRTDEVAQTTQSYDDSLSRATTIVVTIITASPDASTAADVKSKLSDQQQQLQSLLVTAPEPARNDIRQALVATERSQALVAGPRPNQSPSTQAPGLAAAVPEATAAPEIAPAEALREPTAAAPILASVSSSSPPVDVLSRDQQAPAQAEVQPQTIAVSPPAAVVTTPDSGGVTPARHVTDPPSQAAHQDDTAVDEVRLPLPPAPAVVAQSERTLESVQASNPSDNEAHVTATSDNESQNDQRARVVEEPTAQPLVARQSSTAAQDTSHADANGNGHASTPANVGNVAQPAAPASTIAQTAPASQSSSTTHVAYDSGGDSSRTQASTNAQTQASTGSNSGAHPQATPAAATSSSDDHHNTTSDTHAGSNQQQSSQQLPSTQSSSRNSDDSQNGGRGR